jgi:hybrid cluster-associated redox disulfide protein
MATINKEMLISEILQKDEGVISILLDSGLHCLGCPSAQMESLEEACFVHGIDSDALTTELNAYFEKK